MESIKKVARKEFLEAEKLLGSMRGHYIISQALWKAIQIMRTEEYPETSNIKDMEFLRKNIFFIYDELPDILGDPWKWGKNKGSKEEEKQELVNSIGIEERQRKEGSKEGVEEGAEEEEGTEEEEGK